MGRGSKKGETMLLRRVARRATWILMFFTSLVPGQTRNSIPDSSAATRTDPDRSFLLWKLEDNRTAQALVQACAQKQVGAELRSQCGDMAHTRELETEIASRYLSFLYQENIAPDGTAAVPLASKKDGAKFAIGFLKVMIQQDEQGRSRTQSCLDRASREEILTFCHLVQRSRWTEIQLLQDQLRQMQKKRK